VEGQLQVQNGSGDEKSELKVEVRREGTNGRKKWK
jgi:hypothetical protein